MDFRVLVSFEGFTVWKKRDMFCLGGGMNFGYFFGQIVELVFDRFVFSMNFDVFV